MLSAGQENCDGPEYDAMMVAAEEIKALRRSLDLLGIPTQADKDPDKAPPLHVSVALAKRAMGLAPRLAHGKLEMEGDMDNDAKQPERGCLTCGYEPKWTGGQYNCWRGSCRWPGFPSRENRPKCFSVLPVTKCYMTGAHRVRVDGKEVADCPTWEPKEADHGTEL